LQAVKTSREEGNKIVALELTNRSISIWDYDFSLPVTLVVGNEALGISEAVLKEADDIIEIPMLGFKNSINVATAFGIAVYEIQRQYRKQYPCSSRVKTAAVLK